MKLKPEIRKSLITHAEQYEKAEFLKTDPSYFMHQVSGIENQETMAFIASALSYGSRKQFFPKIQFILDRSNGEVYRWVKSGEFAACFPANNTCFYRLYSNLSMLLFMQRLQQLVTEYGTIGHFIHASATDALSAIHAITRYFAGQAHHIIPQNATSACKRICMFLRWMVRDQSPVDLGLWADILDKRSLIIPLDTHVLQEATRLSLIKGSTTSMATALKLTEILKEVFPEDPLKGDFALFGYGINH